MNKKVPTKHVIIICRLDSNRLKNKALKTYKGKSVIEYLVNNILSTKKIKSQNIIISTSLNKTDNELVNVAKKLNVKIFRGSKKNIINRVFKTYKKFKITSAIITSADNPFFLTEVYEKIKFLNDYSVKYTTNLSVGLNLLNCNFKAILKINNHNLTNNNENGFYLYFTDTDLFKKKLLNFKLSNIWKNTRFTMDYLQDFLFFKELIRLLKKERLELNFKNIEKTLKENTSVKKLNIKQQIMYKTNLKVNTTIYYLNNQNKKTNLPYV
jgi:spore coat polysaccharide biosynthesis protein SpsF (cytidylyltransferase family)